MTSDVMVLYGRPPSNKSLETMTLVYLFHSVIWRVDYLSSLSMKARTVEGRYTKWTVLGSGTAQVTSITKRMWSISADRADLHQEHISRRHQL